MDADLDEMLRTYDDHDNARVAFNMALFLHKHERFNEAKEKFDRALELKADYIEAVTARAQCLVDLGQFEDAIIDYDTSLLLGANPFFVNILKGEVYLNQNNVEKAIEHLSLALKIKEDSDTYFERAKLFLQINKTDEAFSDFTRSFELNSQNYQALKERAMLKYKLHDVAGAIADIDICIGIAPDDFSLFKDRGNFLL